ncbi:MAG TPA: RIP metalloprotease RseP [Blastocatellia bacterium]|nr:RIP metalloprotease RseP [Blastocatellia bacterium]
MSNIITTGAAAVAVLGAMIVIHEFGHFIVAKLFRVRVEVFSIGFGKRLIGFRKGDTDYRVSLVPLGGYVKLAGEMTDEPSPASPGHKMTQKIEAAIGARDAEGEHSSIDHDHAEDAPAGGFDPNEFRAKPKWQRLCILFAGPAMNVLTALMIPAALAMIHYEVPAYLNKPAVVGDVRPGSAAEEAGLKPGDLIVKVGDQGNPTWGDFMDRVGLNPDILLPVTIKRGDETKQIDLRPKADNLDEQKIGDAGLVPALGPNAKLLVADLSKGSPAEAAGLKPGDRLLAFNGAPLEQDYAGRSTLIHGIENSGGKPITITVERNGSTVDVQGTPHQDSGSYKFGFFTAVEDDTVVTKLPLAAAMKFSYQSNLHILDLTKVALGQVLKRERSAGDTFAGPIQILKFSGEAARQGIAPLFSLMALLSLNLGIFNLLPIPVLDGGTIFMILLDSVLGLVGFSLTVKIKERMQTAGLVLLMVLMAFVIINDLRKVIPSGSKEPPAAVQPAPTNK